MKKIGFISGSLRKDSISTKIAHNLAKLLPEGYEPVFIEIGDLPLYNEDLEAATPLAYTRFRNEVKGLDGVIFVTPEYNRSFTAALKNALDVGSRPYGQNVWSGKAALIVSQSPGQFGGFGANHHLRQVLVMFNMLTVAQPEVYLSNSAKLLDEDGNLNNEGTIKFLQGAVNTFIKYVEVAPKLV